MARRETIVLVVEARVKRSPMRCDVGPDFGVFGQSHVVSIGTVVTATRSDIPTAAITIMANGVNSRPCKRNQHERNEHGDDRDRGDDGAKDLRYGRLDGDEERFARGVVPVDIFEHHDRVVDDEADRQGKSTHRHRVEGIAEQIRREERAEDGDR